ncbi:hypothetical protein, partial [Actinophytocola sediminis]
MTIGVADAALVASLLCCKPMEQGHTCTDRMLSTHTATEAVSGEMTAVSNGAPRCSTLAIQRNVPETGDDLLLMTHHRQSGEDSPDVNTGLWCIMHPDELTASFYIPLPEPIGLLEGSMFRDVENLEQVSTELTESV